MTFITLLFSIENELALIKTRMFWSLLLIADNIFDDLVSLYTYLVSCGPVLLMIFTIKVTPMYTIKQLKQGSFVHYQIYMYSLPVSPPKINSIPSFQPHVLFGESTRSSYIVYR